MMFREWVVDNLMRRGLTRGKANQVIVRLELRDELQAGKAHFDRRPDEVGGSGIALAGPPLKVQITNALAIVLPEWLAEQSQDHPLRARLKA